MPPIPTAVVRKVTRVLEDYTAAVPTRTKHVPWYAFSGLLKSKPSLFVALGKAYVRPPLEFGYRAYSKYALSYSSSISHSIEFAHHGCRGTSGTESSARHLEACTSTLAAGSSHAPAQQCPYHLVTPLVSENNPNRRTSAKNPRITQSAAQQRRKRRALL